MIRDGTPQRIAGREVVRDDRVVLAEGDRVPADGILVACNNLQVDESLLTGESVPVNKIAAAGEVLPVRPGGDDLPFVYSGTQESERSPLQKQTAKLICNLALLALGMSLLLVLVHGLC